MGLIDIADPRSHIAGTMPDDTPRLIPPARPCPICGKPVARAHAPFCSPRCRLVDLHRWLGESYRIETDEPPGRAPATDAPDRDADGA